MVDEAAPAVRNVFFFSTKNATLFNPASPTPSEVLHLRSSSPQHPTFDIDHCKLTQRPALDINDRELTQQPTFDTNHRRLTQQPGDG